MPKRIKVNNSPKHELRGDYFRRVWLDGVLLDPRPSQKVHNHAPDGFNWGYGGSGPAQLALAIMLKLTGAPGNYQDFKFMVIGHLPMGLPFEIWFDMDEFQREVARRHREAAETEANAQRNNQPAK